MKLDFFKTVCKTGLLKQLKLWAEDSESGAQCYRKHNIQYSTKEKVQKKRGREN
jgi:hypothetical protein